jgi:hypothetical protein
MMASLVGGMQALGFDQRVSKPGTTTKVTYEQTHVVKTAAPVTVLKKRNKQVICVIDESGSMAGTYFKNAIAGATSVMHSLDDNSYFGLYTFDHGFREHLKPHNIGAKGVSSEQRRQAQATLSKISCAEGGTKFFDAVKIALSKFVKPHDDRIKVQLELVVLTDGADGSSTETADTINKRIKGAPKKHPWMDCLHVTVLAVGMDSYAVAPAKAMVDGCFPGTKTKIGVVAEVGTSKIADSFDTIVKKGIAARTVTTTHTAELKVGKDGTKTITQSSKTSQGKPGKKGGA